MARGELTTHELRKEHVAIFNGVYVRRGTKLTLHVRTQAAVLWSVGPAVVSGLAASALHGSRWIDDDVSIELIRRTRRAATPGITITSEAVRDDEVCETARLTVTTPARTAFDIGRRLPRVKAVEVLDALFRATGLTVADVEAMALSHPGMRGIRRLRAVLPLVDAGAESPPESRTRLLLIDSGLPRPETQIEFVDEYGHVYFRLDMGWREWKVAVEYDGEHHWTDRRQRSRDIDRLAELEAMGWRVVRVSAELLAQRPNVVVDRVCNALLQAGCPNVRN